MFQSPKPIGADGRTMTDALGFETMEKVPQLRLKETRILGEDTLEIYKNDECHPRESGDRVAQNT